MKCKSCGQEFASVSGQDKCPHCGATLGVPIPPTSEGLRPPTEGAETTGMLWEEKGPFFSRLFNTWVQVMFHPTRFFKAIPVTTEIGRPLVYALIVGTIGGICGTIWQFVMQAFQGSLMTGSMREAGVGPEGAGIATFFTLAMLPLFLVLVPIIVVIYQFIWSGILHLCLIILGGNKKGFGATFRAMAYGTWSPNVFQIVPFCGAFVALVWGIVLTIIGLKQTHQISTGKAVLAYFLPWIFCACCGILSAILIPALLVSKGVPSGA